MISDSEMRYITNQTKTKGHRGWLISFFLNLFHSIYILLQSKWILDNAWGNKQNNPKPILVKLQ